MAESKLRIISFVILLAMFLPLELFAKRAVLQPVKPLWWNAYKIKAVGTGGSGKVTVSKRCKCKPKTFTIYEINYQRSHESDVQDLYITKLKSTRSCCL